MSASSNPKKGTIQFTKWNIDVSNAYLGPKGYSIPKSGIPADALDYLHQVLMAKPFTPGSPITTEAKLFPVYRESSKKIYIPRYFGEYHFGIVPSKLPPGDDIHLTFNGSLRDYQVPVIQAYLDHVQINPTGGGGLLQLYTAWGKTAGALSAIASLGKKALIIVHKEFLLNQWIERIQFFLPGTRIGRIQGSVIDIENKDIVICMLQSLSMKTYPEDTFKSFGITVVDEVHHIASETFSNALFRVVTPYTLGLSATMNRKDGTTYVFKLFLGNIIHTAVRDASAGVDVVVHSLTYSSSDADFNNVPLDFRGKPQISTMISTLCGFAPRTEFILRTLSDFISTGNSVAAAAHKHMMDANIPPCGICMQSRNYPVRMSCCGTIAYCLLCIENLNLNPRSLGVSSTTKLPKAPVATCPQCNKSRKLLQYTQNYIENPFVQPVAVRQTLVLAHNLNVLKFMYNRMVCRNSASVGYYVGGMKEAALKQSEKCQVLLATYQMAAEGLDISSLNAEFLISPKTDIIQAVGRILRSKHTSPVIVDINDTHDTFKNQTKKRHMFYKKQGYTIYRGKSTTYTENYFKRHDRDAVGFTQPEPEITDLTPEEDAEQLTENFDERLNIAKKEGGDNAADKICAEYNQRVVKKSALIARLRR